MRGVRRSSNAVSASDGVLLNYIGTDTAVPAINVGNHFRIEGLTITRSGTGTRGVIVNINADVQRHSSIRDCWLTGASRCISGNDTNNFVYSTTFENIEFGNFNDVGLYLDCAGATGNVYTNLYFANWLNYPTTKNTIRAFIWLQGSHTEGVFSQINCEHSVVSNQQQYGVEEVWTPSLRGDCEDYALWMKQRVGGQLIYVRTEQGEAHIVLNVNGKIVDNMSKVVYPYSEMKHKEVFKLSEGENGLPSFLKKYPVPKK